MNGTQNHLEGRMYRHKTVVFNSLVAALGGLLFGFDTAVISGTSESLQRVFSLDQFWLGFTVAIALIGTIFGSLLVGRPADAFGRKKIMFALAAFYLISAIGTALATDWFAFLSFRFLGGLAVGGASVMSPMYIAEISPAAFRGRLVAINQLNIVSGILLAFLSNYLIAEWLGGESSWRWMLGVQAVPAFLFFLLLFFIPGSPRWLAQKNRLDEARKVLVAIGTQDVEKELAMIVDSLREDVLGKQQKLFHPANMLPVFCVLAIAAFNQFSGINALMYYAPKIFMMSGAREDSALLQSAVVGGTNLLFTILAMLVIDRFGRRTLLLIGSVGTALCLGIVASEFYSESIDGQVVLMALIGFIAFFAFSQGAVIWVFIAEIFPNQVRAKGQALGSFTHWVMAAAVSWAFPVIAQASGGHVFLFFSIMMVAQFVFAWRIMPETKGLTLEEIQLQLMQRKKSVVAVS